ncbi:Serine/threonine protein kinase [Amycolatopsis marina]|uniref:non-specific serine/threonine protein kinase n=1 Tax=Amycolatopsis marina TaxID=490629 RepID=A0A1I1A6L3_9PSEU|nr:serine/threonine-protein kinase [Amycolatopsis marina]SFB32198.1 Serine/threonine protein kinase [Amycolatopsis marina]
MSDEGRLVAGRYRVIQRIGTGAMGAVWQAQDEVLHRTVAIKQLLLQPGLEENEAEDARQRTMREGRIAARLHHPNAITVFDVVTDENGQPCLIMEYLASTSLAATLQDRRTLPPLEVARIGAQVAAALKEAHAVGIVHRDIKPGNILLAPNGLVKITDFGISRATDDVTVTKTGMIAGTPAYLAPEVAIGGDPGPEADVFSLGSTLYAACEGQPPFGLSENTLSLLHAVAAGQINPPRQSGPLASVLAVLLHPDIRHRPTAEECEDLLSAVARGETPIGGTDATRVGPAVGLGAAGLGAGAAGAALAGDDNLPANHSGTLGDEGGQGFYDSEPEDGYAPASGYPDEDYDDSAGGYDATRAVPAATAAYGHGGDDGYGGYGPGGTDRADDEYDDYEDDDYPPPADEQERRGNWKVPAAIGGVVAAGLVALGVWIATGPHGGDEQEPAQQPQPAATTSSPSSTLTSPTSSEPVETEPGRAPVETVQQTDQPRQPQEPPPPPPTSDQEPEPPGPTTTTKTSTTASEPPEPSTPPSDPPPTTGGGTSNTSD